MTPRSPETMAEEIAGEVVLVKAGWRKLYPTCTFDEVLNLSSARPGGGMSNSDMESWRYAIANALRTYGAEMCRQALEEAAETAINYDVTVDFDREHQPWAREANMWLRSQNLEVSKRIRALKDKPAP